MKLKKHMEQEHFRVDRMHKKAYKENNFELTSYYCGIHDALDWVMGSKDEYLTKENWEQCFNVWNKYIYPR